MLQAQPEVSPTDIWVLLWSKSQCALHIETLDRTFRANAEAFAQDRRMDYVVLMAGDRELVDEIAELVRPTVIRRAEAKDAEPDVLQAAIRAHEEQA